MARKKPKTAYQHRTVRFSADVARDLQDLADLWSLSANAALARAVQLAAQAEGARLRVLRRLRKRR